MTPFEQAKAFLGSVTEVEVDGEYLVTAVNEHSAEWNEQLVAKAFKSMKSTSENHPLKIYSLS